MKRFNGEIIAVVPEFCAGPGWTNTPVWIIWRDDNQVIHQDCLQPEDQPPDLVALFDIGAVVQSKLKAAVDAMGRRA